MNAHGEIVLLHISDLHRRPGAPLSNDDLFLSLRHDVHHAFRHTNEALDAGTEPLLPGPDEVDAIVVTGDLTQSASEQEFAEAEQLLDMFARAFVRGDHHRIIIVPGNHDVDWRLSQGAYTAVASPTAEQAREAERHESEYRLIRNDPLRPALMKRDGLKHYQARFGEYRDFIRRFYGGAYDFPLAEREKQYVIFDRDVRDLGVVFVGFSSCDLADHLWHRGTIHHEAILNASQELDRRNYGGVDPLRVAVWHHNILGNPGQMDFMDPRTAVLLAHHRFSLGLHGHVHAAGQTEMSGAETALRVVWAGSLGAAHHERPESVPMLYNVIGINGPNRKAWVHTRSRDNEHAPWRPYSVWGSRNRCWYAVDLDSRRCEKVYSNVHESRFLTDVSQLIRQSSEIAFVGTGLNVLYQQQIRELIVSRARQGLLKATICFGNPFAPHVRARLVEEERGDVPPEVAEAGIVNRVKALLEMTRDVPAVQVKLFNNYPTMSIFRFDCGEYVYYPMGYRKLGNTCPVMSLHRPSLYADFLDEMINRYLEDAVDAREVFRVYEEGHRDRHFVRPDEVRAVALYIFPDPMSAFHEMGSRLLGYDALAAAEVEADDEETREFRKFVGGAPGYGFHVTVLDLAYVCASQIPSLLGEIRAIGKDVRHFDLDIDRLHEGYSWPWSVELLCSDPAGELEKLQAEMTVRILPTALGTNYTLDPVRIGHVQHMSARAQTFCEAYQTPHVLSEYHPHFTVAAPGYRPPAEDRERLCATVSKRFAAYLQGAQKVRVDKVYFVQRPLDAQFWDPPSHEHIIRLMH